MKKGKPRARVVPEMPEMPRQAHCREEAWQDSAQPPRSMSRVSFTDSSE